ncbi:coiled-coil domain-containing protein [Raoultibacter phocaeensis]|uniref:coiled-coil domain-containing protein n=1 Tax=Raoultibacter phocaeensis TaxID=2479841 RepID=UPI00111B83C7|nr:hypothetical protein [Raoultibacter phocaeensis]
MCAGGSLETLRRFARDHDATVRMCARGALCCVLFWCVFAAILCGAPVSAHADEVADAQAALEEAEARLTELQDERAALEGEIVLLQEEIDATIEQVKEAQRLYQTSLKRLQNSAVFHYKLGGVTLYDMVLSTDSVSDLIDMVNYLDAIEASLGKEAQAQLDEKQALEDVIKELDAKKVEQNALRDELAAKEDEAKALVDEASARVDEAERERLERMAALAAPSGPLFATGGAIDGSWQLGFASAYSFADNDGWDATASGIPLDWTSYTVAVPISQRYLLGSAVEISYNGMSLVATVTDVGGFESYGRALDLAPGVWRAFGANNVNEWGVRQVAYRFL